MTSEPVFLNNMGNSFPFALIITSLNKNPGFLILQDYFLSGPSCFLKWNNLKVTATPYARELLPSVRERIPSNTLAATVNQLTEIFLIVYWYTMLPALRNIVFDYYAGFEKRKKIHCEMLAKVLNAMRLIWDSRDLSKIIQK